MRNHQTDNNSISNLESPKIMSRYIHQIHKYARHQIIRDEPNVYDMLRYSMGWVDDNGKPSSSTRGKALRPTLCLYICEAVGGNWERAIPAAVALELIHNFSLIHDDIQDQDHIRHHRPTLWSIMGTPKALIAGNMMRVLADITAMKLVSTGTPNNIIFEVINSLTKSYLEMIEGQYLDLEFESKPKISISDYLKMISLKTGALIKTSITIGATIGTTKKNQIKEFNDFGKNLGFAFQIRDDYLGIWGKSSETGKPVGADILRKKNSFPIIHSKTKSSGSNSKQIEKIFSKDNLTDNDLSDILQIMDELQTREYTLKTTDHYCDLALNNLNKINVVKSFKDDLINFLEFFRSRAF